MKGENRWRCSYGIPSAQILLFAIYYIYYMVSYMYILKCFISVSFDCFCSSLYYIVSSWYHRGCIVLYVTCNWCMCSVHFVIYACSHYTYRHMISYLTLVIFYGQVPYSHNKMLSFPLCHMCVCALDLYDKNCFIQVFVNILQTALSQKSNNK